MTIHTGDPFATPEDARSPVRRLRGRLPAAVTLWTAPGPAGLTVSSTLVIDGEPGSVFGVIDDESDLWSAVEAAGTFAVTALTPADRQLADRFAGLLPAPGGLFRDAAAWRSTPYGPVPLAHPTWAGCRVVDANPVGWGLLVRGELVDIGIGDAEPLVHYRGGYRTLS